MLNNAKRINQQKREPIVGQRREPMEDDDFFEEHFARLIINLEIKINFFIGKEIIHRIKKEKSLLVKELNR